MKFTVQVSGLINFAILLFSTQVQAAEVRVAVASNFLIPIKYIAEVYEQETGEKLIVSAGSTGKLYAQIVNGAPYDVFLAANSREPERLEKEGFALKDSRFTYARGRLALWAPKADNKKNSLQAVLKAQDYQRLSMANPLTAPYGAAAKSVLQNLNLDNNMKAKVLRGENISQAYQYTASGAADLGFVALSQLKARGNVEQGHFWLVDEKMHEPILQQAVLLNASQNKVKSKNFLSYLKSSKGQLMIENFGYGLF